MMDSYLKNIYAKNAHESTVRQLAKHVLTTACIPLERRRANTIGRDCQAIKLHLGCADTYLNGWVNVDLLRPGRHLDLRWDLRRPLPFKDSSVDVVFSEHLFEHIPLPGTLALLRECHRVMRLGGVFRVGVPDLERYIHAYVGDDPIIDLVRPGRPTRALALSEIFFLHGHRVAFDFETFRLLLETTGFHDIVQSSYCQGRLQPSPDSASREPETLYVEAVA